MTTRIRCRMPWHLLVAASVLCSAPVAHADLTTAESRANLDLQAKPLAAASDAENGSLLAATAAIAELRGDSASASALLRQSGERPGDCVASARRALLLGTAPCESVPAAAPAAPPAGLVAAGARLIGAAPLELPEQFLANATVAAMRAMPLGAPPEMQGGADGFSVSAHLPSGPLVLEGLWYADKRIAVIAWTASGDEPTGRAALGRLALLRPERVDDSGPAWVANPLPSATSTSANPEAPAHQVAAAANTSSTGRADSDAVSRTQPASMPDEPCDGTSAGPQDAQFVATASDRRHGVSLDLPPDWHVVREGDTVVLAACPAAARRIRIRERGGSAPVPKNVVARRRVGHASAEPRDLAFDAVPEGGSLTSSVRLELENDLPAILVRWQDGQGGTHTTLARELDAHPRPLLLAADEPGTHLDPPAWALHALVSAHR